MTMESFFDEYAHFYLIKQEENEAQYLLYESQPTYAYNWQWEADPDYFYEETKIYNGVRAANLSDLCHLPKLQPQSRKSMSKLIQGVRDRKSTRLNSSHPPESRMPSSA